ncbi:uncharacterized protein TM35_001151040 [Trypanosoma theileri]|uniref:Mucin TcMUCII n=1 Tax=Trypanosoma theileri TaxID=67003 RepID=A0A1X0NDQ7_9TRYP|nr:uncharacterized protein TM35_001151040 [Trypanosoma theileri]ORC81497.1 hypothetical protein TM35_001151040 [Trypanosoma theileri]
MSVRHVPCVLTIALCCVCSCVVADDGAQALEANPKQPGSEGLPAHVNEHSGASPCQPGSTVGKDGTSPCLESGGGVRNDDRVVGGALQDPLTHSDQIPKTEITDQPPGGSGLTVAERELSEQVLERKEVGGESEENLKRAGGAARPDSSDGAGVSGAAGVAPPSPTRETESGGTVKLQDKGEALAPAVTEGDDSLAAGHGNERQITAEGQAEKLETPPQERDGASTGRTTTSSTNEVSSTGTEENNENQQAEGNGIQSTSPTSPAPTEGDAMRDTDNTPSNNEESTSTTTTTTTTTLPPELTNNKKGDADSSSSISSSVWVRVPLLIVVTLACILVC